MLAQEGTEVGDCAFGTRACAYVIADLRLAQAGK